MQGASEIISSICIICICVTPIWGIHFATAKSVERTIRTLLKTFKKICSVRDREKFGKSRGQTKHPIIAFSKLLSMLRPV